MLRPDVVWFGESLPQDVWKSAIEQASSCDVMVVVGTSLAVSPANLLPVYAKQNGATMIEVNIEQTPLSSSMDISLRSSAASTLPVLVSMISK
jgi:NAD-dependent deacetylase